MTLVKMFLSLMKIYIIIIITGLCAVLMLDTCSYPLKTQNMIASVNFIVRIRIEVASKAFKDTTIL